MFLDGDGRGRRDGAEPLVAGLALTVYDAAGFVLDRTTTGDDGIAAVSLPEGSPYRIGVSDVPQGWLPGTPFGVAEPSVATAERAGGLGGSVPLHVATAPGAASSTVLVRALPEPTVDDPAADAPCGLPSGVAALIIAIAGLPR